MSELSAPLAGLAGESAHELVVRDLGRVAYEPTFDAMRNFTLSRTTHSTDELWCLEHDPVFTQGQAGKAEHLLAPGDIPVVQVDRGGQVTYHGPGQLVVYTLIDIKRLGMGIRQLVSHLEHAVVNLLALYGIDGYPKPDAPGVYVGDAKIASLGLRIKRGCAYHGLALNVDMDLEPFGRINPCGYQGLAVTRMLDEASGPVSVDAVREQWLSGFARRMGYGPCRRASAAEHRE